MTRPLCAYCGERPVRGRRFNAKKCALCQNKRPSRNDVSRDISAAAIDRLFDRARLLKRFERAA